VAGLREGLDRLGRLHEDLRRDVAGSREASLLRLGEVAQDLSGEIAAAQRGLVEVRALEQGRARQIDRATDSLRRLEAVFAGSSTRGSAGENVLARALRQLPPELLEVNCSFGSRVVEYALRLPGGRLLPIDSKWSSLGPLERLSEVEDPGERRRLLDQVARELRVRVREMGKYLDPERTLDLGLLAVPDAVYEVALEGVVEASRDGVLVVPYSLALPYVLGVWRLSLRLSEHGDAGMLAARLHSVEEALRKAADEVESRLSRALVQIGNSRDALRDHLAQARRAAEAPPAEAAVPRLTEP
jgi:DNA recombination protein RmuC